MTGRRRDGHPNIRPGAASDGGAQFVPAVPEAGVGLAVQDHRPRGVWVVRPRVVPRVRGRARGGGVMRASRGRQVLGARAESRPLEAPDLAAYLVPDPEMVGAACAAEGIDADTFFPDAGNKRAVAAAKAICFGCPVRAVCLARAEERGEQGGVFGGRLFPLRGRARKAVRAA